MERPPKVHDLKCDIGHYMRVHALDKPYEIRFDDRDYQKGDFLLLRPTLQGSPLSGFEDGCIMALITHKMTHKEFEGLSEGYCSLGIRVLHATGPR